jgi:hypothetical protein
MYRGARRLSAHRRAAMICVSSIAALAVAVALLLALAYGSLVAEHRRLLAVHDALLREIEAAAQDTT